MTGENPPAEPEAPSLDGSDSDGGRFYTDLFIAERSQRRRLSRVPALVFDAVGLVWRTDRLTTAAIVGAQFVLAGVAAVQVIIGGYAVRELLDLRKNSSISHVALPLILLAVVSAIGTLSTSGSAQFGRLLGARVQRAVSATVLDVTSRVELVDYDDSRFYDQLSRVLANVPVRPFSVVTCIAALVGGVFGSLALLVTLAVVQPILLPIVLVGAVPLWLVSRQEGRLEFGFVVDQTVAFRERQYLEETLSRRPDAAELRAYLAAAPLRSRWDALYDDYLVALRGQVRKRYALGALGGLAAATTAIVTLLILVVLIQRDRVGLAQAGAAAIAIRLLIGRLQQLAGGLSQLFESALFLGDYDDFVRGRPASTAVVEPFREPATFRELQLTDVGFRYPQADRDAVHGVSLTLRPGEVVALVGENGSGKTTLAKMMAGLYQSHSGEISLNGDVIEPTTRARLRDQTALVLQDFTHYALSAAENIALGRPEKPADRAAIEDAAKHIGADQFLHALPDGYDTRLSRMFAGGRELSLGQWQRVALARAFYRDAPLVILDEPTSALDPRAEARLYESVRSALTDRTVILVTHRLASVRSADRILVLSQGSVVEEGTHDELMAHAGLYAELVTLQKNHHIKSQTVADDEFGSQL